MVAPTKTSPRLLAAITLFLMLGVGFALAELLLRLLAPQWSDQWKIWEPHPRHAIGVRPSVKDALVHGISGEFAFRFRTNRQGLRMVHDLALPKPRGLERILFVGDSFTFGFGVEQEESFAARLQETLDPSVRHTEIVNGGFAGGFTLDTEYIFVREEASRWEPNLVVVGICLSNDLEDLGTTRWIVREGGLYGVEKLNDLVPLWVKRSALANLVVKGVVPKLRATWAAATPGETATPVCALSDAPYVEPARAASVPLAVPPLKGVAGLAGSERADYIARAWAADAFRRGYRLRFLFIPDRGEVEGHARPSHLQHLQRVRSVFRDAAAAAGVPIWDPTLAMRQEACAKRKAMYFGIDGHWNAEGHRFAAEWLAKRIKAEETLGSISRYP